MSLWTNLRGKLPIVLVLMVLNWFLGGLIGFPPLFRLFFMGYILVGLLFFVLLDVRFRGHPRHGGLAVVTVFLVASVVFTLAARLLPQFDPQVEQEKIARIQKSYLDRQKPARAAALKKEAEELGLQVIGEVAASGSSAAGSGAAPSPELIERGKQAYQDWECYNCHKIGGSGGVKRRGPELDNIGNLMSPDAIRAEILDPRSSLAEGFEEDYDKVTMPDDFGKRLSEEELNALVAYLSSLKDTSVPTPKPLFPGSQKGDRGPFYEIPVEYQRVVPESWWTDPEIIEEGKRIYEGQLKPDVVCAACHGRDGKPVMTGAADFTDQGFVEGLSSAFWYWRIATGVPGTPMTAWAEKLTPEEIMKVIVYENALAYGGEPTDHNAAFYPPKAQR